ncbi:CTD nuclear envelope phosphatase 1 homolog [Drosophila serrata]|uniref:CTD nuclear envelope phosphatase 1 homolog n=1 Tax=Drosophila serrata TaxID=7274 RepID=UPI000A1D0290|nr:CTD nuclear envelope phosphatase 1 homolog [Drosophila serrata]
MVSPLPVHSVHIEKLASHDQMAYSMVGHPQNAPHSAGPTNNQSILGLFASLGNRFRRLFSHLAVKIFSCLFYGQAGGAYREVPLSPESLQRLQVVGRKTLVLDLDETLVHSCYTDPETQDEIGCSQIPAKAVPDFRISVSIDEVSNIPFRVFKRPHVDKFLNLVSKWYDLVIYTASLEVYASKVVDLLDGGREMLTRRLYRQHCHSNTTLFTKDLTLVNEDLRGVFIIDNSPNAYVYFPHNALPIKSFIYDPNDRELLNLLPFLDALRFTKDVRSVLGRRVSA